MNMSILNRISEYAKENNVSISGVYYKFPNNFPEAFHRTVNNFLEKAYSKYSIKGKIDDFFIGFDKNKNAYFQFIGKIEDPNDIGEYYKVKEVRLLVFEDNVQYDFICPPSLIMKENIFLENIKNLDNAIYLNTHNELPLDFTDRFFRDYLDGKSIEKYFEELSNNIISYISYLTNESNLSYQMLENEINNAKEIKKIYFMENESSTNITGLKNIIPRIQSKRKNTEIPIEERLEILDSYSPSDEFQAISKNSSSSYHVKVFKTPNKCKLVMEPVEGNKYTKVVHLDSDKLDRAEIIKIVIDSLELSRNEVTKSDNITRHKHSTLEEYKNLLEYLINSNKTGLDYDAIKRINEASQTKER